MLIQTIYFWLNLTIFSNSLNEQKKSSNAHRMSFEVLHVLQRAIG